MLSAAQAHQGVSHKARLNQRHQGKEDFEIPVFGFMPEQPHAGSSPQGAENRRGEEKRFFRHPPGLLLCAPFVIAHQEKGNRVQRHKRHDNDPFDRFHPSHPFHGLPSDCTMFGAGTKASFSRKSSRKNRISYRLPVRQGKGGNEAMIRSAEIRDIPGILELLRQVDLVHHNGRPDLFKGPATKYSAAQLEKILSRKESPVFVAEENGKIAGHAFCLHERILGDPVRTDVRTLYIDDICVDEACRGRGIGRALYEHVLAYARAEGFYNVTLNVWTLNPGAVRFYEALGMTPQKIGMEQIL